MASDSLVSVFTQVKKNTIRYIKLNFEPVLIPFFWIDKIQPTEESAKRVGIRTTQTFESASASIIETGGAVQKGQTQVSVSKGHEF